MVRSKFELIVVKNLSKGHLLRFEQLSEINICKINANSILLGMRSY